MIDVNELQKKHGVQILIPGPMEDSDNISIIGKTSKIKKVREVERTLKELNQVEELTRKRTQSDFKELHSNEGNDYTWNNGTHKNFGNRK